METAARKEYWVNDDDFVELPPAPPRPLPLDRESLQRLIRLINQERERQGITPKVEAGETGHFQDPVEGAWQRCLTALDGWDFLPPDLVRQVYNKYVEPTIARR